MTRGYRGAEIALLTQHGKQTVIAPVFRAGLDARIEHVSSYDTDRLGTFTRDVPRSGSQIDAARTKARIAVQISGLACGMGSEGVCGADPGSGLVPWATELVLLLDTTIPLEVCGWASGIAHHRHGDLRTLEALRTLALAHDFPRHWVTLRPDGPDHPRIFKNLYRWDTLDAAFDCARRESSTGTVFVETDLRAHANPTRMSIIEAAARDLVQRLASHCPACGCPGFGRHGLLAGLPCRVCRTPSRSPVGELWRCLRCEHREERKRLDGLAADPSSCDVCNP